MDSTGKSEGELLILVSEKVAGKVSAGTVETICPALRIFIYSRAKVKILTKHPEWGKKGVLGPEALNRIIERDVLIDLTYYPQSLVDEFAEIFQPPKKIEEVAPANEEVPKPNRSEAPANLEVDKVIKAGGLTKLMIAAGCGDLAEVQRLVEVEGANIDLLDNSKMTAADRAQRLGHLEVARYLRTR